MGNNWNTKMEDNQKTFTDRQRSISGDKLSEDEVELHLWQKAYFLDDGSSVRHSADSLRMRLAHLHYCCTKEQLAGGSTLYLQHMMGEYLRRYGRLVDGPEEENKGLANFTAAAKALSTGHRRDCRNWKPSLTMDSMMEIPGVQAAMKAKPSPDKPLICERRPLPIVPLSPPGRRETGGSSTSQQQQQGSSKPVQRLQTSPYGVFSKTRGQQTSQGSSHAAPIPRGPGDGPSLSHSRHQPGRRQTPTSLYSTSIASSSGVAGATYSSSVGGQSRGKGRMVGGYNEEGRPHSKRARMSATVDEDGDDIELEEGRGSNGRANPFITAKDQHAINQQRKYGRAAGAIGGGTGGGVVNSANYGTSKRSLGARRGFVPPIKRDQQDEGGPNFSEEVRSRVLYGAKGSSSKGSSGGHQIPPELEGDERLRNIEPRMVELITNEIMDHGAAVLWDDIAGLHFAKATIKEIVVWPMLRPDIFKGLRGPPKGILLFGPPGTGKTLIGKCVASQVRATFFSISASSLTSKWVGEGEKMVRALFAVARCYQPAVIFIDEIDSLLSQRSDSEHESSRRIKTEFLVQLDGATTSDDDRLLVIGATNRPQEIDEAARRRLVKRLYIPLPDSEARKQIVSNLMKQQPFSLSEEEMEKLCQRSEGYSGADMANLCREAAYGPVREAAESIQHIAADEMRPVLFKDFESAFSVIRPSVSEKDLGLYIEWNKQFGCGTK